MRLLSVAGLRRSTHSSLTNSLWTWKVVAALSALALFPLAEAKQEVLCESLSQSLSSLLSFFEILGRALLRRWIRPHSHLSSLRSLRLSLHPTMTIPITLYLDLFYSTSPWRVSGRTLMRIGAQSLICPCFFANPNSFRMLSALPLSPRAIALFHIS